MAYLDRQKGRADEDDYNNDGEETENLNINKKNITIMDTQILSQINENTSLKIENANLKRDITDLENKLAAQRIEGNKRIKEFEEEVDELGNEIVELNGQLGGALNEAERKDESFKKMQEDLKKCQLENLILRVWIDKKELNFGEVQDIYPALHFNTDDNLEVNGLIAQRKAGEKLFKLKRL